MRKVLRQLSYVLSRREKRNGILLLILMMVGALLEVVGVGAIPAFIASISVPDKLLEIDAVAKVYATLGVGSPEEMVLWAAGGLILVFALKNAYLAFLAYARARYSSHREVSIANRLFRAYMDAPYTFHLQRNTAELLRNTNTEARASVGGVIVPLLSIVMEAMVLVFILALLISIEPAITLIIFAVFGFLTYAFWRFTRVKISKYAQQEVDHNSLAIKAVNQGLGGFKDARVLSRERFFVDLYSESTALKAIANQYKTFVQSLPRLFLETVAILGLLGIAVVFIAQDRDLDAIVPTLALIAVAVVRLMPSFTKISNNVSSLQWGTKSLSVVYSDLSLLDPNKNGIPRDNDQFFFESEIHLDALRYAYPGQNGYALEDVSLTIPKNASVGFVGPSGSGKTTIVDVILGLLPPGSGRVMVDGTDIHDHLRAWQRKIGYIPQQIYLTDDSVRRNVAFGQEDDNIDDNAVWAALEAAQLRELVEGFPEGLDAFVGERGVRLSGGQRQRIGIARALYHQPEVLIMDEATSALDNQTERQFVEALERLQGNHTMIVIAHRLSTVQGCDRLFMLDQGRLVADGTYEDLLARSEDFRQMAGEVEAPNQTVADRPTKPAAGPMEPQSPRLSSRLRWN